MPTAAIAVWNAVGCGLVKGNWLDQTQASNASKTPSRRSPSSCHSPGHQVEESTPSRRPRSRSAVTVGSTSSRVWVLCSQNARKDRTAVGFSVRPQVASSAAKVNAVLSVRTRCQAASSAASSCAATAAACAGSENASA